MRAAERCLLAIPLVLLGGCLGANCDSNDACLSGRCTWGTCDSALVHGIAESVREGRRDEEAHEVVTYETLECVQAGANCEWLSERACEATPGCAYVPTFCVGSPQVDAACFLDDDCSTSCSPRSTDDCKGDCLLLHTCEWRSVGCRDLDEVECETQPGCELRAR